MNFKTHWRLFQTGLHLLKRDLSGQAKRYKRYTGTAREICRQIITDRWNGTFFEGGSTLFDNQFWIRDYCLSLEGILDLGFKDEAIKCLNWALEVYQDNNHIGTTILGRDTVYDFWEYSADSIPWLLGAIKISGIKKISHKYKNFLNSQINKYYFEVYNSETGLVKNLQFSTPKDVSDRSSSCVANAFMVYLAQLLKDDFPWLDNPFERVDLLTPFLKAFWVTKGGFFRNDIQDDKIIISADANLVPFRLGIITDQKKLNSSLLAIQKEGLDRPFPIKYHSIHNPTWTHWGGKLMIPNYQGDSIWTMMGPWYIELLYKYDPQRAKII